MGRGWAELKQPRFCACADCSGGPSFVNLRLGEGRLSSAVEYQMVSLSPDPRLNFRIALGPDKSRVCQ